MSSSSLITVIKSVKLPDEGAKWDAIYDQRDCSLLGLRGQRTEYDSYAV